MLTVDVVVVVVALAFSHLNTERQQEHHIAIVGVVSIARRRQGRRSGRGRVRGERTGGGSHNGDALLGLLARPVLVVGMLLQVQESQALGLVHIRPPGLLVQLLPASAQTLADLGVVQVGRQLADAPPLDLRPHHERVHRPLHVVRALQSTTTCCCCCVVATK